MRRPRNLCGRRADHGAMLEWLRSRLRRRTAGRRTARRRLGDRGERIAVRYLVGLGYRIVATNVLVPLDRTPSHRAVTAEIDAIAYDGATLVFVEVKTRRREGLYPIERAVDARKRRLMARAARRYRRFYGLSGEPYRFEIVTVLLPRNGPPRVRCLKSPTGAFKNAL
jgi:putative endonuclease